VVDVVLVLHHFVGLLGRRAFALCVGSISGRIRLRAGDDVLEVSSLRRACRLQVVRFSVGGSSGRQTLCTLPQSSCGIRGMSSNNRLEFALARPTRKSDALLLAAQPER
jgi:hypothetical protein